MGKIMASSDLIETGNRIRAARQCAGLTQEALADEMGVAWNTVHRIEYAQSVMGIDKLFQIADILHVPVQELCPSRLTRAGSIHDPENVWTSYARLSEKNKKVVIHTVAALLDSLMLTQEAV